LKSDSGSDDGLEDGRTEFDCLIPKLQKPQFMTTPKRWVILTCYFLLLVMIFFTQFSLDSAVPKTQILFNLETPSLINYSSILFQYAAIPGLLIGIWCRKRWELAAVIYICSFLTIIGAVLRHLSLVFNDFWFILIGNTLLALA
jgi:hypothetical protein